MSRLVLVSCEALENYPPGLPGKAVTLAARVPGALPIVLQPLRCPFMRRLPMTFGWMSKRRVPDEVTDAWFAPILQQAAIRNDLGRYLRELARLIREFVMRTR